MAKKSANSKGFRKQTVKKPYLSKKEIIALCVIVVALIVGAILLFSYDDGALKIENGAVVADGDNWLIVNGAAARGRVRYFKLGEAGEIDGYTREKSASLSDANVPLYAYAPEAEGGAVNKLEITTTHTPAEQMAKYASAALGGIDGYDVGEVQTGEYGGKTCAYFFATHAYAVTDDAAEGEAAEATDAAEGETTEATDAAEGETTEAAEAAEGETTEATADAAEGEATEEAAAEPNRFDKLLYAYVDAAHDSSIVFHVESNVESADAYPADDAMTPALDALVAAVTLEPGK